MAARPQSAHVEKGGSPVIEFWASWDGKEFEGRSKKYRQRDLGRDSFLVALF